MDNSAFFAEEIITGQNQMEIAEIRECPTQKEFLENTDKSTFSKSENSSVDIDGGAEKDNTDKSTLSTGSPSDIDLGDKDKDKTVGRPVQVRDGWRAFFTVLYFATSTFLAFGNARTLGIFFKQWKAEFAVSPSVSSWVPSCGYACVSFFAAINPFLNAKFQPKTLCLVGGIVAFAGFISASFSQSFVALLLLMMIAFAGNGLVFGASSICTLQWNDKYRPLAMGIGNGGTAIGSMALPLLYDWIAEVERRTEASENRIESVMDRPTN